MKMRSEGRQREKILLAAAAFLLILSLMSGSVLAGFLAQMTGSGGNDINLFGGKSPGITISNNLASARKLGYDIKGDEETKVWGTETRVDIFRLEYDKDSGQITVRSADDDRVIAPGTANDYNFTVSNPRYKKVKYVLWVDAKVEPEDLELPIQVRMEGPNGSWALGNESEWKEPLELDGVTVNGTIWKHDSDAYTISWKWPFEQGDDALDTLLGNRAVDEPLTYTIRIHTRATKIEIENDSDDYEPTKPTKPTSETTAGETKPNGNSETTAANESSANETTANGGNGETNGTGENGNGGKDNGSDGTGGKKNNGGTNGTGGSNGNGETTENGDLTGNNGNGENGNNGSSRDDIDKNGTISGNENNGNDDSTETGNQNAGSGFKFPWGILLLPILIPFLFRRHIYVTGFLTEEAGMDLYIKRKKDTIRPNGRFVFPRVTYGKHTFALCNADGEEKSWFDWAVKRDKDVEGIVFDKDDDGRTVIRVGKKIRAIEIWLDVKNEDMEVRKLRWAAIDKDHNVYTLTGMTEPNDDKTNITPDGLKVDEHGQYSF